MIDPNALDFLLENAGRKTAYLCRMAKVSPHTVIKYLQQHGVEKKRRFVTMSDVRRFRDMRKKGLTYTDIAELTGFSRYAVYSRINSNKRYSPTSKYNQRKRKSKQ